MIPFRSSWAGYFRADSVEFAVSTLGAMPAETTQK
jgi:hypothetical protein